MKLIKYLNLSLFLVLLSSLGLEVQAQAYVFKVLGISGSVKKITTSGPVALTPGTKLQAGESIVVESGYCGLMHQSGKGVEVKKPGTYQVADLAKGIAANSKGGKISDRYVSYVMGQLTKEEAEDINANHRKYMEVTGSVDRGSPTRFDIKLLALKSNEILAKTYTLNWTSDQKNVEYILEVKNLFNEGVFTAKTKETSAAVDFAPLFAKHGKNLLVTIKVLGKPEVKSAEYNFNLVSSVKPEDLGLSDDKAPVNCMVNGMICEEHNLFLDALAYYKEAYSQEGSVEGYKEAYMNLYKLVNENR